MGAIDVLGGGPASASGLEECDRLVDVDTMRGPDGIRISWSLSEPSDAGETLWAVWEPHVSIVLLGISVGPAVESPQSASEVSS